MVEPALLDGELWQTRSTTMRLLLTLHVYWHQPSGRSADSGREVLLARSFRAFVEGLIPELPHDED